MTDNMMGGMLGTIIGAGILLKTMDIIFDKKTGKYYDKKTGREVSESEIKKDESKENNTLKKVF